MEKHWYRLLKVLYLALILPYLFILVLGVYDYGREHYYPNKLGIILELERRGKLPQEKQALLNEARNKKLFPYSIGDDIFDQVVVEQRAERGELPEYTVRDKTTGRVVTFRWFDEKPPVDADFEENIF